MPTPLLARVPHDAEDGWDADRVPHRLGLAATSVLRIRGGTAMPPPPARRSEGPGTHGRWCLGQGGRLTDPSAFVAALEDPSGPRPGEEAAR